MTINEFEELLLRRIAQVSIGASSLRNQGDKGIIGYMRNYFEKKIDVDVFFNLLKNENEFKVFLNSHTTQIFQQNEVKIPWGAARKGLNLFLRDLVYSNYFSHKFKIPSDFIEFNIAVRNLEVPLDNDVAQGIIHDSRNENLKWNTIKRLRYETHESFQNQALLIANEKGIARVNLDLIYWRKEAD
jgi:hypothetical protein